MKRVLIHKLLGLFVVTIALTQTQGCSYVAVGGVAFKFTPGPAMHVKPNFVINDWFYTDGQSYLVPQNRDTPIEFNPNAPGTEWVLGDGTTVNVQGAQFTRGGFTSLDLHGFKPSFAVRHPGVQTVAEVRVHYEFRKRGTHESYSAALRAEYEQKDLSWISDRLKKEDKSKGDIAWTECSREVRTMCLQVMTGSALPDQDKYRALKLNQLMKLATAKDPGLDFKIRGIFLDRLIEEEMTIVLYLHFGQTFSSR